MFVCLHVRRRQKASVESKDGAIYRQQNSHRAGAPATAAAADVGCRISHVSSRYVFTPVWPITLCACRRDMRGCSSVAQQNNDPMRERKKNERLLDSNWDRRSIWGLSAANSRIAVIMLWRWLLSRPIRRIWFVFFCFVVRAFTCGKFDSLPRTLRTSLGCWQ